ncbi:DUF1737 domain-containing protein [Loktanella sp. M215]|nr:DUF1737 domain-containing protein [Loktanella sp. M215]
MNYQLITTQNANELVEMVEGYLDAGWKLQGGHFNFTFPRGHFSCGQHNHLFSSAS